MTTISRRDKPRAHIRARALSTDCWAACEIRVIAARSPMPLPKTVWYSKLARHQTWLSAFPLQRRRPFCHTHTHEPDLARFRAVLLPNVYHDLVQLFGIQEGVAGVQRQSVHVAAPGILDRLARDEWDDLVIKVHTHQLRCAGEPRRI